MEKLTEQISADIGPKWVQLFARFKLGHRDRYRICALYKSDPKLEQEIKCTRDTIRLWQQGLSDNLSEQDVMTQLLSAYRTVKGFEERADELAESYGITLNQPLTPSSATSSQIETSPDSTSAAPQPTITESTLSTPHPPTPNVHTITKSPPSTVTQHTVTEQPPHSSVVDSNSEVGSSDHSLAKLTQKSPTHHIAKGRSSDYSTDYSETHTPSSPNSTVVDISIARHKHALLDVCQRLPPGVLTQLALKLEIPRVKVREISADFPMVEERYYQVLKHWVCAGGRTFVELRGALEACQQPSISDLILRRLQSKGLTLS